MRTIFSPNLEGLGEAATRRQEHEGLPRPSAKRRKNLGGQEGGVLDKESRKRIFEIYWRLEQWIKKMTR